MAEKYSQEELNQAYFTQLVFSLQAAAMHQMGKIVNPLTGKVEKDMIQAKYSIDMLSMLEEKTKGNLNEHERKLIERILFELRMNYVDEMQVSGEEKEGAAAEEEGKGEERELARGESQAKREEMDEKPKTSQSSEKAKPRKKKKISRKPPDGNRAKKP